MHTCCASPNPLLLLSSYLPCWIGGGVTVTDFGRCAIDGYGVTRLFLRLPLVEYRSQELNDVTGLLTGEYIDWWGKNHELSENPKNWLHFLIWVTRDLKPTRLFHLPPSAQFLVIQHEYSSTKNATKPLMSLAILQSNASTIQSRVSKICLTEKVLNKLRKFLLDAKLVTDQTGCTSGMQSLAQKFEYIPTMHPRIRKSH